MDSDERIGLGIAATAIVTALLFAALGTSRTMSGCQLPIAIGTAAQMDQVPHISLPDSGGVLINGRPLGNVDLETRLVDILSRYAPEHRVVFVLPASPARCRDVAAVARAARAGGGTAYDWARTYPGFEWLLEPPAPFPAR